MSEDRPNIPKEDYQKPLGGGSEFPPLDLLPSRSWLGAKIIDVEYRIVIFNGQIQYLTKKTEAGEEESILDDNGEKIPRREFNITFSMHNYSLPNGDPRKTWLTMGASLGDQAHLPTFLYNTLGHDNDADTPDKIINRLKGLEIRLQLKNKPRKDKTKPPYQQVVYDAVEALGNAPVADPVEPIKEDEIDPSEPVKWDE